MKLRPAERDYYVLEISTNPALDGTWQASFDDGATWVNGAPQLGGLWAWLVAGPDFNAATFSMDAGDTDAVITEPVHPLLRIADNPVLDIETGPSILLEEAA